MKRESFFLDQDEEVVAIDILKLLNGNYRSCISKIGMKPSSEKVEKYIFQFMTERSVEELEATRPYLIAKLSTEVYMTADFLKACGKFIAGGGILFTDGVIKVGTGGAVVLSIPGGGTVGIPVVAVGAGEMAAEVYQKL